MSFNPDPVLTELELAALLWHSGALNSAGEHELKEARECLAERGLLEELGDGSGFCLSERAQAHLEYLLDVELPRARIVWDRRHGD